MSEAGSLVAVASGGIGRQHAPHGVQLAAPITIPGAGPVKAKGPVNRFSGTAEACGKPEKGAGPRGGGEPLLPPDGDFM
ncbi:hypothetical protein Psi01_78730 [Planobispora siamensis]|uniref:Uncharacterized protein n=1 Tax=Planobispora siamensis TaxID=936338 RepID=A0A8J3SXB0_9ACTN|nr:hypothetical protein Psi01_78730 [Planobispora siamensis]